MSLRRCFGALLAVALTLSAVPVAAAMRLCDAADAAAAWAASWPTSPRCGTTHQVVSISNVWNREAAASRGAFRDPFGIFGPGKAREDDERAAFNRRLGKLERGALTDLDLDATADSSAIRVRYIELVKRCHPDANGGDRSAEHKLQRVIRAYKTLRRANLA